MSSVHPTDFISSHGKEAVKQWFVYDGLNRMVTVYVALTDAGDGDRCLRTDYTYIGSSARIQSMRESIAAWDAAWDS